MPLSIINQFYIDVEFYCNTCGKPPTSVTDKHCHIRLYRVHLAMVGNRTHNFNGDAMYTLLAKVDLNQTITTHSITLTFFFIKIKLIYY